MPASHWSQGTSWALWLAGQVSVKRVTQWHVTTMITQLILFISLLTFYWFTRETESCCPRGVNTICWWKELERGKVFCYWRYSAENEQMLFHHLIPAGENQRNANTNFNKTLRAVRPQMCFLLLTPDQMDISHRYRDTGTIFMGKCWPHLVSWWHVTHQPIRGRDIKAGPIRGQDVMSHISDKLIPNKAGNTMDWAGHCWHS